MRLWWPKTKDCDDLGNFLGNIGNDIALPMESSPSVVLAQRWPTFSRKSPKQIWIFRKPFGELKNQFFLWQNWFLKKNPIKSKGLFREVWLCKEYKTVSNVAVKLSVSFLCNQKGFGSTKDQYFFFKLLWSWHNYAA